MTHKIVSVLIAVSLMLTLAIPAFAANLTNSTADITYDLAVDGSTATAETKTAEATVTAAQASTYSVKIPKTISLNGTNGNGNCNVSVKGNISGNQTITIAPVDEIDATESIDFYLSEISSAANKKSNVIATVNAAKTTFVYSDLSAADWADFAVALSAPLTAGTWTGTLTFNIAITNAA